MDGGAWQATVHGEGHKESDMTEQLHFQTSLNIFKVHPSCSMCQNVISFQG